MFFGFAGAYLLKKRMGDLAMRGSAVVLGLLTVLTMSRTAWVGMAAGFVAREVGLGVRAIFRRLPLLAAAAMVVFLAGWYPTIARVVRGRFPDTVLSDNSVTERLYYFDIAWQTFLARPLLGGGVAGISSEEFVIAHSVYLQVLGELGLVGTLLMLTIFWLWASFLFRVCRIAKQSGDRRLQAAGAAMLGLAAFFLVSFIFAYDLEGGEPFIAMAMSSALYSSGWVATRRREIHARRQEQLARRQQQRLRRKARLETAAAAPS
jgi:O-antigen ligase